MGISVWILGDQLFINHPAILKAKEAFQNGEICLLMIESNSSLRRHPYSANKIILLLSAMRHYAETMKHEGFRIDYRIAEDMTTAIKEHVEAHHPQALVMMSASSFRGQ